MMATAAMAAPVGFVPPRPRQQAHEGVHHEHEEGGAGERGGRALPSSSPISPSSSFPQVVPRATLLREWNRAWNTVQQFQQQQQQDPDDGSPPSSSSSPSASDPPAAAFRGWKWPPVVAPPHVVSGGGADGAHPHEVAKNVDDPDVQHHPHPPAASTKKEGQQGQQGPPSQQRQQQQQQQQQEGHQAAPAQVATALVAALAHRVRVRAAARRQKNEQWHRHQHRRSQYDYDEQKGGIAAGGPDVEEVGGGDTDDPWIVLAAAPDKVAAPAPQVMLRERCHSSDGSNITDLGKDRRRNSSNNGANDDGGRSGGRLGLGRVQRRFGRHGSGDTASTAPLNWSGGSMDGASEAGGVGIIGLPHPVDANGLFVVDDGGSSDAVSDVIVDDGDGGPSMFGYEEGSFVNQTGRPPRHPSSQSHWHWQVEAEAEAEPHHPHHQHHHHHRQHHHHHRHRLDSEGTTTSRGRFSSEDSGATTTSWSARNGRRRPKNCLAKMGRNVSKQVKRWRNNGNVNGGVNYPPFEDKWGSGTVEGGRREAHHHLPPVYHGGAAVPEKPAEHLTWVERPDSGSVGAGSGYGSESADGLGPTSSHPRHRRTGEAGGRRRGPRRGKKKARRKVSAADEEMGPRPQPQPRLKVDQGTTTSSNKGKKRRPFRRRGGKSKSPSREGKKKKAKGGVYITTTTTTTTTTTSTGGVGTDDVAKNGFAPPLAMGGAGPPLYNKGGLLDAKAANQQEQLSTPPLPGAFYANAYYDSLRGKMLSVLASPGAPALPPSALLLAGRVGWKAGQILSDRVAQGVGLGCGAGTGLGGRRQQRQEAWPLQPQVQATEPSVPPSCRVAPASRPDCATTRPLPPPTTSPAVVDEPPSSLAALTPAGLSSLLGDVVNNYARNGSLAVGRNSSSAEYGELVGYLGQRVLSRMLALASASASTSTPTSGAPLVPLPSNPPSPPRLVSPPPAPRPPVAPPRWLRDIGPRVDVEEARSSSPVALDLNEDAAVPTSSMDGTRLSLHPPTLSASIVPEQDTSTTTGGKGTDDTSSSDSEDALGNTVKLVFVGGGSGASTDSNSPKLVSRLIKGGSTGRSRKNSSRGSKRSGLSDVSRWDADQRVTFNVFDMLNEGSNGYKATNRLLFSNRAIYVIVWDMAVRNPQALLPSPSAGQLHDDLNLEDEISDDECSSSSSSSDENEHPSALSRNSFFDIHEAQVRAHRVLEKEVDESVISWIDIIAERAPQSIVLPICMPGDNYRNYLSEDDAQRRRKFMKERVLEHQEMARSVLDGTSRNQVKVVFDSETGSTDNTSVAIDVDTVRRTIINVGRDHVRSRGASWPCRHIAAVQGAARTGFKALRGELMDIVQRLRKGRVHVIEWPYLVSLLKDEKIEDILDALHFLQDIGELVLSGSHAISGDRTCCNYEDRERNQPSLIILNTRWLMLAASCILHSHRRSDLVETSNGQDGRSIFANAHSNCPTIGLEDAQSLWQMNDVVRTSCKKAFGGVTSRESSMRTFGALIAMMVKSRIIVPVDSEDSPRLFLLPSLLPLPQMEWTYKCSETWKTCLCNSWRFMKSAPANLMEHIMVQVLRDISTIVTSQRARCDVDLPENLRTFTGSTGELQLCVHELLCWRTAFYLKLGTTALSSPAVDDFENVVEIVVQLVDKEAPMCVAANSMDVGTQRLLVSGKGLEGHQGRRIWDGGFTLVNNAVQRVIASYNHILYPHRREIICPRCLSTQDIRKASSCKWEHIENAIRRGDPKMTCSRGHRIDTRSVAGLMLGSEEMINPMSCSFGKGSLDSMCGTNLACHCSIGSCVPVKDLLGGVVLVGLWDGKESRIVRAGSGFVIDRKRGLIVTASHTLIDIDRESATFGENYYGSSYGKVVIGVLPSVSRGGGQGEVCVPSITTARFRYFGEIASKDVENMDACVVRITTRMEHDVLGNGDGCAAQPEIPLTRKLLKREQLKELPVKTNCELEERVKIMGYNQGGEGLLPTGAHLNRVACYSEGYVCKWFKFDTDGLIRSSSCGISTQGDQAQSPRRKARRLLRRLTADEEIVVMCPTIIGHSGGPCVNQAGEVIGILSSADKADDHRCYVVPSREFMPLVDKARMPSCSPIMEFIDS